ncbi:MAG: ATP-binding protein [Acidobacteria bacterium]|nr:ATP-binding protein [Acidobacteriota bacterium]
MSPQYENPFRPGAGHKPPYLAGRQIETDEFKRLLGQPTILENLMLTGLRGVGKTVLLDAFKPIAIRGDWLWVGTDLEEAVSISEHNLVVRLLTDLSTVTSSLVTGTEEQTEMGFTGQPITVNKMLNYEALEAIYKETPGLESDRLKAVLETVWALLEPRGKRGVVFAYDEAQNLTDNADRDQFPLSLLLDVFQSIQRKNIPFMLALTGLPTLVANLVEARTFSERMFRILFLQRLSDEESREAVEKPTKIENCPVLFSPESVDTIVDLSAGYPYFIQFICREVFDLFIQQLGEGQTPSVPVAEITHKLDSDFFAGRWSKATDRQRELLYAAATLQSADSEFTVRDLVRRTRQILQNPFKSSHANQMLKTLCEKSLVYKNRHGKYSFAVPLLHKFILRNEAPEGTIQDGFFDERA